MVSRGCLLLRRLVCCCRRFPCPVSFRNPNLCRYESDGLRWLCFA